MTDVDRLMAERELRMRALEQEVNALCLQHGEAMRYPLAPSATTSLTVAASLPDLPDGSRDAPRGVSRVRQAELSLAFLASVSQDLAQWANVDEMMRTVGVRMAAHLQLSLCAFVDIDETAERVVINHDWHREDVPGLVGVHLLADFVGEKFILTARAGEAIVVSDVRADPRTDSEQFAALKIASFICMPLMRDGQWRFALCLYKSVAYDWRDDEIELARELTARIWTRLERLRTDDALRQSEERFRALVTVSSDVV